MNANINHPTDYFNNDPSLTARPCIFFVEGNDDGLFLSEVLKNLKVPKDDAGIIKFGGLSQFKDEFSPFIKTTAFTQGLTKSVAIIFDSDKNSAIGKKTIITHLKDLNIETTPLDKVPLGDYASLYEGVHFGLFSIPIPSEPGTIETLCLEIVREDLIASAAHEFISNAQKLIFNLKGNLDKRKAQVYLAGRAEDLCAGVGMGCVRGIFDIDHAVVTPLKDFIKSGLQKNI